MTIPLKNTPRRYGWMAMVFHWAMAAAMIFMLSLGYWMTSLEKGTPERLEKIGLHKSIGVTILFLAALRLIWRLTNAVPPEPQGIPRWQRLAARASHILLYGALFGMPLSGWAMSSAGGHPIPFFGLGMLPPIWPEDEMASGLFYTFHETCAWLLIVLISIHVLAALKHHFYDRDDVLRRILPVCEK